MVAPRRSSRVVAARGNSNVAGYEDAKLLGLGNRTIDGVKRRRDDATEVVDEDYQQHTQTPRKRQKNKRASKENGPNTPNSSQVNVMNAPYGSGDIDDSTPPPNFSSKQIRTVDPHMTIAPLRTPKGSKIISKAFGSSKIKNSTTSSNMGPETTTENILEKAKAHLIKVDPRLRKVVDEHHCHVFSPDGLAEEIDPFRSLVSGIMAQQVSGAAAKSIKAKFIALFNADEDPSQRFPSPEEVSATEISRLRLAGLSQRKAEYIQGLAIKFVSGELTAKMLAEASDQDIIDKLTAVRGLGMWSVEMFACFALKRMDILSTGDLGVQRGMAAFAGRDVAKLKAKGGGKWKYMSEKEMLEIAEKFRPYRSLLMWYLWRIEGNVDITAIQDK